MSKWSTAKIENLFKNLEKPAVIFTVGNSLRSDDGVGPYIANNLPKLDKALIINAQYNPENFIDEVIDYKPKSIVFIDAADFGKEAGELELVDSEGISEVSLSTHMVSLKVIAALIEKETDAQVYFIGIQPQKVNLGEGLSLPVKKAAEGLLSLIKMSLG